MNPFNLNNDYEAFFVSHMICEHKIVNQKNS